MINTTFSNGVWRFLCTTLLLLILPAACLKSRAQDKYLLTVEAFAQQVKQYHPVAKQADLLTEKAKADLLTARGAFDPVIDAASAAKTLDGTNYYQYTNPEIKLPTGIGVSIKGGYEKSSGQYINPERTRGVASYLGMEIPLLNGLLTDRKRTTLQQAKIYLRQSEQERLVTINDLLFNAYSAYWEWTGAWYTYQIYSGTVNVAAKRARLVNISFMNGDRAMANTIEAWAQLQNMRLLQNEALLELNRKKLELSNYLWTAGEEPYLLPDDYIPDTLRFTGPIILPDTSALLAQTISAHPALQITRYKAGVLETERKLKLQNFLPVVNLQANLLSKDYYQFKGMSSYYLENNYKLGVNVKVPLLWRQNRGEYRNVLLKIRDNNLELDNKLWDLQNKIRKYFNEAIQLQAQLQAAREMNKAYDFLLRNEELKLQQGESSLFLINARENKTLEMQQKVVELQVKYRKAAYGIQWSAGLMATQ